MACQFCMRIFQGHIFRAFKYLNNGFIFIYFYDTADLSLRTVYDEFHDLVEKCILYALQRDQRAVDAA